MALLDHVRRCNAHDLARYRPLLIGGARVGYVAHAAADLLRGVAGLDVAGDRVAIAADAATAAVRTAVLEGGADRRLLLLPPSPRPVQPPVVLMGGMMAPWAMWMTWQEQRARGWTK